MVQPNEGWQQQYDATMQAQNEAIAANRARVEDFQNAGRYPYWEDNQHDTSRSARGPGLNTIAVLALISVFIFAPLGIVLGIIGRRQTDRTGQSGHGMATTAVMLGVASIVIPLIVIALSR
jgi:hypothetical protein